jgi:hypothetical protein
LVSLEAISVAYLAASPCRHAGSGLGARAALARSTNDERSADRAAGLGSSNIAIRVIAATAGSKRSARDAGAMIRMPDRCGDQACGSSTR